MSKVKIFSQKFHEDLTKLVNEFLEEHEYISIHYQDTESGCSCLIHYNK